ncbi:GDSL-type esterase/lipase family protein [Dysosmobacter sp.]
MLLYCLGDSITAGPGVPAAKRWTSLVAQRTGWTVVNCGVSGDTGLGMLLRLQTLLTQKLSPAMYAGEQPWVYLWGGCNDIFCCGTDSCARLPMATMLHQLLSAGIQPVVGLPLPVIACDVPSPWAETADFPAAEKMLGRYSAWLAGFCASFHVETVDFQPDFMQENGLARRELFLDGLHPTAQGHSLVASRLIARLSGIASAETGRAACGRSGKPTQAAQREGI